jgi:hypothetical protein
MTSSRAVVAWRRALLTGMTALIALLAFSFGSPSDAHAMDPGSVYTNPRYSASTVVSANHTGWVDVKGGSYSSEPAWFWTGRSWVQVRIPGGTHAWAVPYSRPYHWIWTQRTGWLAIQTSSLERHCGYGWAVPCS